MAAIARQNAPAIPPVTSLDGLPSIDGLDLWDLWPAQLIDGSTALFDGWTAWMILSAPAFPDPIDRHAQARIRLVLQRGDEWRDCGNLLPDGFCPGSREWAGSALYDPETRAFTLFWTPAGRRGEEAPTFEQRLFKTTGTAGWKGDTLAVEGWSEPEEFLHSDDEVYDLANQQLGAPGEIIGFRDPAHFRDPADGRDYMLFTGSLKDTQSTHNGVIGIARADDSDNSQWTLLPPLISADGVNNEQERPHVICRDGLYYVFWSTQTSVFEPNGPKGPTGLYGMVSRSLLGPYSPLNGTGLVAPNPAGEPWQTFSWWVTADLEVVSFVDYWGMQGEPLADHPERVRSHFGGVPAPRFSIKLDAARAWVTS
ncbi:MAG: glycoside hydrolase family 68 protein [Rhizobiaceae bacterium]